MISLPQGPYCANELMVMLRIPRRALLDGPCDRRSKRGIAVKDGDTPLHLGPLALKVAGHGGLAEQLDTAHLAFDAAPAMISAAPALSRVTAGPRFLNGYTSPWRKYLI